MTIENGWYRSGNTLFEVRSSEVVTMQEITTRGGGQTVFLDPREFDGTEDAIAKYDEELEQATAQLSNPFTELELLGSTYDEAYQELETNDVTVAESIREAIASGQISTHR